MMLLTTNFDLLRHILIKDFNNFVDRSDGFLSSSPFPKSLFFAKGMEWRRHRQIVSPTFSTGKLKYISKSVDQTARNLSEYIERSAKENKLVPIKELSGKYTCQIIAKTAFGLDAKFIDGEDDEFYNYAKNMLRLNPRTGIRRKIFLLLGTIPHLRELSINTFKMQYFDLVDLKANEYFGVILKNTISERKQQQKTGLVRSHVDFLDLLLKANDAAKAGKFEASEDELNEAQDWKPVDGLNEEEIIGHSMLVIFAGMETTATTLQMCLYELAANPDIQVLLHGFFPLLLSYFLQRMSSTYSVCPVLTACVPYIRRVFCPYSVCPLHTACVLPHSVYPVPSVLAYCTVLGKKVWLTYWRSAILVFFTLTLLCATA